MSEPWVVQVLMLIERIIAETVVYEGVHLVGDERRGEARVWGKVVADVFALIVEAGIWRILLKLFPEKELLLLLLRLLLNL